MHLGTRRRHRRDRAILGIVEHAAHPLDHARLDREKVPHRTTLAELRIREIERTLPCLVRGIEPMQRVDQRVAARQRDGDQICLELHLARQRALRDHDTAEQQFHQRADGPDHEPQQPADPGNAEIDPREFDQERIERITARDDVAGDLLADVHPAPHRHRALREMPELMRQHGFQFAQRQYVDQCEADFEILA